MICRRRGNRLNMPCRPCLRSKASIPPWMPPQMTKFQEAPCHRPPSSITSMRLAYV